METQIWKWSATDVSLGIRQRKISAREALLSCLDRLEQVNSYLNAVVDVFRQEAIWAADAADHAVKQNAPLGPLHGVPITIKINVDFAGRATTNGVAAFKDVIAPADSAVISNLRKAGAVIFGRTNVPCFSTRLFTDNDLYGRTLNPWDAARTPGGSSGGAAAAVATGIGAIGHGNDRAGSIRFPAYACGVFGFRPSPGRVPEYNPTNREERNLISQLTNTQGPLARSVSDAKLAFSAMAKEDRRDPWWLPPFDRANTDKPCRVALFMDMPEDKTDATVAEAIRRDDQLGDEIVRRTHLALQPSIATSLMGLPALAAPVLIRDGVPIGVQVAAGRFQEERCFAIGEIIDRRSPVKTPIDPIRTTVTCSQTD